MFYQLDETYLRGICREHIENMEMWSRRIIHETLTSAYGNDYLHKKDDNGQFLINKQIREKAERLIDNTRCIRPVDTLFFDDLKTILAHNNFYKPFFKVALDHVYPQGRDVAIEHFKRLVDIRNALSHSNPISVRQAERAVCYTNDFIDGIKQYYKEIGEDDMWNVPTIIKLTDSKGYTVDTFTNKLKQLFVTNHEFYVGEQYWLNITIDPSFSSKDYNIVWSLGNVKQVEYNDCTKFNITFTNQNISKNLYLNCKIISTNSWHKYGNFDHYICIKLTVYPPK